MFLPALLAGLAVLIAYGAGAGEALDSLRCRDCGRTARDHPCPEKGEPCTPSA